MAIQPFPTYNASFADNDGKVNQQESSTKVINYLYSKVSLIQKSNLFIKECEGSLTDEYWQYFLNILSYGILIIKA